MKGEKFALERRKQVADITKEMLDSGEEIVLKPYVLPSPLPDLSSLVITSVLLERSPKAAICTPC